MSIEKFFTNVEKKIYNALDDYNNDLAENQREEARKYTGIEKKSIIVKPIKKGASWVGIDEATLLRLQYNVKKVNYAVYDIEGHDKAKVGFRKRVPDSKRGANGIWWHVFPATGRKPNPIINGFRKMSSFSEYYKKQGE